MPRAGRTFEEGRTYHVYNRVGGGLLPFTDRELCKTFVRLLSKVVGRDSAVVLGWCLLGNHYHLVVRQGPVPLSRAMKTLQQGVTRARNLKERVYGPLRQGRFKVNELAHELGKSRDGVSRWIRRGTAWRASDLEFAADAENLDHAASEEP